MARNGRAAHAMRLHDANVEMTFMCTIARSRSAHRICEDEAIQEAPSDVGQRDIPEDLPVVGAQRSGSLLF